MKINRQLLGCVLLLSINSQAFGQTEQDEFEAFSKQAEREFTTFKEQSERDYQHFRDSVNQAYANFLEQAWAEFEKRPAIPKPKEEEIKPLTLPKEERGIQLKERPIMIEEVVIPAPPTPQPIPIAPIPKVKEPKEEWVQFTTYGTQMKVRFKAAQRFTLKNLNEHEIAEAWRTLSKESSNNLIRDCLALRNQYQLCDWAYLKVLEQVGKACMGDGNEGTLLTAFIYCQSGYQMRMGMSGERLYLLYATDNALYDFGCYLMDHTRYYVLAKDEPARLTICQATYPKEQALSLTIQQAQRFAMNTSALRDIYSLKHTGVGGSVQVNKNLIDFFSTYPSSEMGGNFMTRWAMYANTPLQEDVKKQLYPSLQKHLTGKEKLEAVSVLLDFVQWGFTYKYDEEIWGYDRAFFAEETLFYPYADCEDRSILFSRLVRDLCGLKVALVYYPGHLATAVCFPQAVQGDYLTINGERYTICDPTYFGAPVGKTMPKMDNQAAKVIVLE